MKNNKGRLNFEQYLGNALKSNGYLFPESDEQLDIFLSNLDEVDIPAEYKNSNCIFNKRKSDISLTKSAITTSDLATYSSIAAREGGDISDEVKRRMKRDKENAKKK